MKTCTTCAVVLLPDAWNALPLVGWMNGGCPRGVVLEMRNCKCGSTLAIERPFLAKVDVAQLVGVAQNAELTQTERLLAASTLVAAVAQVVLP